jgi:hypothetical protein
VSSKSHYSTLFRWKLGKLGQIPKAFRSLCYYSRKAKRVMGLQQMNSCGKEQHVVPNIRVPFDWLWRRSEQLSEAYSQGPRGTQGNGRKELLNGILGISAIGF